MIRPPGWDGAAFTDRSDGDVRADEAARVKVSSTLGISDLWAVVHQVHSIDVVRVSAPGESGDADGLWTTEQGLPLAVFTADCFGVVLRAPGAVGVAHAGWRGAVSGIVNRVREEMAASGNPPNRAAVGPGIGPCCFEVGPEVEGRFDRRHVSETTWGSTSVDLPAAIMPSLEDLEVWSSGACTLHETAWFSHRDDGTSCRMAAIGWLP